MNKPLTPQERLQMFIQTLNEFEYSVEEHAFKAAHPRNDWGDIIARVEDSRQDLVQMCKEWGMFS